MKPGSIDLPDVLEMVGLIQWLAERTGKKLQYQQARAFDISDSRLSCYLRGEAVPTEKALQKMLVGARVPVEQRGQYLVVRQRAAEAMAAARRSTGLPPEVDDLEPSTPRAGRRWGRRRAWVAGAVVAGLLLVVGVSLAVWVTRSGHAEDAAGGCNRYQVTADTLAIRSAEGEQLGRYFDRDARLTVERRTGPAGNKYWYVVDDAGRGGWVLPSARWWRAVC